MCFQKREPTPTFRLSDKESRKESLAPPSLQAANHKQSFSGDTFVNIQLNRQVFT